MSEQIIEGGYVLIPVWQICAAWAAYQHGLIQLRDFRLWLACHEMKARRFGMRSSGLAKFEIPELHRLVGGGGAEHLRASIRRLQQAQLLHWSVQKLAFPQSTRALPADLQKWSCEMTGEIKNSERLLPVPRRVLRLLAAGARKAVIATALGHLLRCLYLRGGKPNAVGTCKASWLAEVFGVSERNVKAARSYLVHVGWLRPQSSFQWHLNRFGLRVEVNLSWSREQRQGSPLIALSPGKSTPPDTNKKLQREYKNQKPATRRPAGFRKEEKSRKPNLRHVVRDDLCSSGRLLELFRQAVAMNVLRDCESERLQFLAAAEHANAVGTRNPPGLFCTILRNKLWHFITQKDEDRARQRVLQERRGTAKAAPPAMKAACVSGPEKMAQALGRLFPQLVTSA